MALNPPLTNGIPVGVIGEQFLLKRNEIGLKCRIQNYSFDGRGKIYLSSYRIVFVADKPTSNFNSLDIPLANIRNEKYNQPFFGFNYLSFQLIPVPNLGFNEPFDVNLVFKSGGSDTFLKLLWNVIAAVRFSHEHQNATLPQGIQSIALGTVVKTAYVDPSDPSVLYTTQPHINYIAAPTNYPIPVYAQPYYTATPVAPVAPVAPMNNNMPIPPPAPVPSLPPMAQYNPQQYTPQPQQYSPQPQQYNNQQQYSPQPQQYNPPQQYTPQPQQYNPPQQYTPQQPQIPVVNAAIPVSQYNSQQYIPQAQVITATPINDNNNYPNVAPIFPSQTYPNNNNNQYPFAYDPNQQH
ncbi:hypothetical protein WA158_005928 [Blastocystis sp. Blastoise]